MTQKIEIADEFNRFFESVFTMPSHVRGDSNLHYSCACPMEPLLFDQEGVFSRLLNLDAKKASGPDNIPTAFLKRYAEWVSFFLVIIFKKSLETHSIPQDWLCAIIILLFKAGNRMIISNYRPVSLTSVCCKVIEHIIAKHIIVHLEVNQLLNDCQHGFRSGKSTVTQLIQTIHDFSSAIDDRKQVDVICIDFAKAFDVVNHTKLLFKLRKMGFSDEILNWIGAYLSNRKQAVRIDGSFSATLDVFSGVPQGSVLGPLLFLLYINDISTIVKPPVKMKLYADDCLIYMPVSCTDNQLELNKCLEDLELWCCEWDMQINFQKTTYVHITNKKNVLNFQYNIGSNNLCKTSYFKYLGVTITNNLTWHRHIESVCSELFKKLFPASEVA